MIEKFWKPSNTPLKEPLRGAQYTITLHMKLKYIKSKTA
jgi:hypothetical protein